MEKEILFAKALQGIKETAKIQGNVVTREQVEEAFAKMELAKEQLEMVYEYLRTHKIGIEQAVDLDDYLTEEEKDYLAFYLEEIQSLPQLSEREKEAVLFSAMAGDEAAKKKTIEIFLPKVVEISKLYTGQGVFLEDLIGEGNIALTSGVMMLGCLEHASEAEGMLAKMMMDAMENFIQENMESEESDKKILECVNQVAQKADELSELLKRKVTIEELTEETGYTQEEVKEVIRILGGSMEKVEDEKNADRE